MKIPIDDQRYHQLCDLVERKKSSISFKDFTCSEIRWLIDETPFSPEDKEVAIWRFVENRTLKDIMQKAEWFTEITASRHCRMISNALKNTCFKIFNK